MSNTENNTEARTVTYNEYIDSATLQQHYDMVKKKLTQKLQNGEKLRVAFYVLFDSIFQSKPLYKLMLKDDLFEPFIVVIPHSGNNSHYILAQMGKTFTSLSREFEHVYQSYSKEIGFIDFSDKADLVCFSNVYDHLTHEFYTMRHAITTQALPFVLNYGLYADYYAINCIINLALYNSAWKVFADTMANLLEFTKYTVAQGKNVVLTGYGKMDALAHFDRERDNNHANSFFKKIFISPHHAIDSTHNYVTSNFIEYAALFLELPQRYPNIYFIFRPHPFLFEVLSSKEIWSQEKIDQYLTQISNFPNMEYQDGGDYLETFANSDAIIHDCGSFIAEYLYTDNPACFMVKSEEELPKLYTKLGLSCISQHELAYNSNDIIKFIDEVVINGIDTKKEERIAFANKYLKINYPHASNKILEHIKEELCQNKCENDAK